MKKARVLLADDHRLVLEGLKSLLECEFDVVGSVEDGQSLLSAVKKIRPDVVVIDVSMPLLNGIDAARRLRKENKSLKIVFLTMHRDVRYAMSAFEAGASGYVLKHSTSADLITAIREALDDRTFVTPLIAGELIEAFRTGVHRKTDSERELTGRQREILQLLAEGRTTKEIASVLDISARTVEFHKYSIMEILGVHSIAELVKCAIRHGLVSP